MPDSPPTLDHPTPSRARGLARSLVTLTSAAVVAFAASDVARATAPPPTVDLGKAAMAELRVGDPSARVRRLWGRPLSVAEIGPRSTWTFGFAGGALAVQLEGGRVRTVAVRGTIRTTKADSVGMTVDRFRRHWGGTIHRGCCAVGIRHVRVGTTTRGTVFAATFRSNSLVQLALTTDATFRECFLAECD